MNPCTCQCQKDQIIGVDFGSKDGDDTVEILGHIEEGNLIVTEIKTFKARESKE